MTKDSDTRHIEKDNKVTAPGWRLPDGEGATRIEMKNRKIDENSSGTARLSSTNPFTCISTASYIFCSASSRVSPVAAQPGKSGEYAE